MDEGDRPGRGGYAFVLDDEHFPYFRYPTSKVLAEALAAAVAGTAPGPIHLTSDQQMEVVPTANGIEVRTPAGVIRSLSAGEASLLAKDLVAPLSQAISS